MLSGSWGNPLKTLVFFYIPRQPNQQLIKALQPTARVELPQFLAALEELEDGFLNPGTRKKAFHFRRNIPIRLSLMIHT